MESKIKVTEYWIPLSKLFILLLGSTHMSDTCNPKSFVEKYTYLLTIFVYV